MLVCIQPFSCVMKILRPVLQKYKNNTEIDTQINIVKVMDYGQFLYWIENSSDVATLTQHHGSEYDIYLENILFVLLIASVIIQRNPHGHQLMFVTHTSVSIVRISWGNKVCKFITKTRILE